MNQKVVALDAEMVEDLFGRSMLARISIVDKNYGTIYDKFVKPTAPIRDYRTRFSGISRESLFNAEDFDVVQYDVKSIIQNAIVVGHSLHYDFEALQFQHPKHLIVDLSKQSVFYRDGYRGVKALRHLAEQYLKRTIQNGPHSSVVDAVACMELYKKYVEPKGQNPYYF